MAIKAVNLQSYEPALKQMGLEIYVSDGTPTESGALKGAICVDTTNGALYLNTGTPSAATWNNVAAVAASEITLADGSILAGNASGVAAAVTPSGNVSMTNAGVFSVTGLSVTSQAAGDTFYATSGTAIARIAKGTAGQINMMNAGGTAPNWVSMSGDVSTQPSGQTSLNDQLLKYMIVELTNAEILALRAAPKTLINAPGAGRHIEFISAEIYFDYTAAYTETTDNMAFKYENGAGATISETIEATGFVDATADVGLRISPSANTVLAKTAFENKAVVLHNTGDGEYGGGNAANKFIVKIAYRIHNTQL